MKKITVILLTLTIVFLFTLTSCGSLEKKIVGTWTYESSIAGIKTETKYIFRADGTGATTTVADIEMPFTYSISDDQLTITNTELGISKSTVYTVEIKGDTLKMTKGSDTMNLTKAK